MWSYEWHCKISRIIDPEEQFWNVCHVTVPLWWVLFLAFLQVSITMHSLTFYSTHLLANKYFQKRVKIIKVLENPIRSMKICRISEAAYALIWAYNLLSSFLICFNLLKNILSYKVQKYLLNVASENLFSPWIKIVTWL